MSWSSQPADGLYTLLARATDNVGNTTDSAPITVTVTNTPPDTSAPSTPVLTLTETVPEAHVVSSTLFYNPAAGSTTGFTVEASTTDAESGITKVAFPTVFGGDGSDDTSPPYSTSYSWSGGATASGVKSVTATNGAGLTATSTFTVTPDSDGSSVTITDPGDGATIQNGQVVSAASSDAASGVAQVEFRFCAGSTCAWNAGTTIDAADSSAPYEVSWRSQPADGPYTLLARATDNVGNTTDSAPVTVIVANILPDILALTASETDMSVSGLMTVPEESPTPEATGPFVLTDTVTTTPEVTETVALEDAPTPTVTEVPTEILDGATTPAETGVPSTERTRMAPATALPAPTPAPAPTPEVTPTPAADFRVH